MYIRNFRLIVLLLLVLISVPVLSQETAPEEKITNKKVLEGIELFRQGKMKEALTLLEKEAVASPGDADVFNAIAIIQSREKKFDEALKNFDKAISLKTGNFKTMYNKLNLLVSMGKIAEARAMLKGMTEQYPQHATGWVNYGAILMQTGEKEEAIRCFDKAISINKDDFDAYFKKGQALMLMQKYAESKVSFEASLKINANYSGAKQGLIIVNDILQKKKEGYIRIAQILVKKADDAERIKKELDAGADFSELARKNSVDAAAQSGGHLGFVKRGDLVKVLEDVIFALKVKEISPVVKSSLGFHIFLRIE